MTLTNFAENKVTCEYQYEGGVIEYTAYVTINKLYEVQDVRISYYEAFDKDDQPYSLTLDKSLREQLEAFASLKALEKIEEVDFHKEVDRD